MGDIAKSRAGKSGMGGTSQSRVNSIVNAGVKAAGHGKGTADRGANKSVVSRGKGGGMSAGKSKKC